MSVSALVGADFKFRNVRLHRVVGQNQFRAFVFQTASFRGKELDLIEVGNQSGIQHADGALLAFAESCGASGNLHLRFVDREIIRLVVVAIAKNEIVVEDEIRVVIEVHHQRQIGD